MASSSEFGYNIGEVLTENLDELIFVLNEDFECEFVNEKIHIEKLGYLSLKNKITVILHQDDLQLGNVFLQRLLKNGQAIEHLRIRQKNSYVYYEFKGKTFTNEKQEIKLLIYSRDISQFKRSEREWLKKEEVLKKSAENLQEIRFWKLLQTTDEKTSFQKSREMLDLVIDNIPQIIYWKNKDLVYLGCNQNYALINNFENPNYILGKFDEDLPWAKINLNTIQDREKDVMNKNQSEISIETLNLPGGKTAFFEVNRVPLNNLEGGIVGILCTYNNISDRVNAEQTSKRIQGKFTDLVGSIREAYFEVDLKGNFSFMNKSFIQMTGYLSDEMIGKNYSLVMDDENKNKVFKMFNAVFISGLPQESFQFEFIKKGDKRVIVETSVYLSRDPSGRKLGFYGITRDITQRFKLEQELKQSEEKYRHLFENSPFGIWIIDLNGVIIDCNAPKNIMLSKVTRDDIIGKNFIEVLGIFGRPEYFIPFFKSKFEHFVEGTPMKALEFKMTRTDGIEKWINVRGLKIELGENTFIQVLMQDITEKKIADLKLQKSEEELKILNKELERKVLERTKELRESEEKFRTIAENSLMGVAIIQDNKVKYINQQFAILSGYDVDEVKEFGPMDIFQSIYPDDRKLVMEQLRKKQKGLKDYISHYQYRIFDKEGGIKWVDNYSKTINFMGRPADLVSGIDITDRKKAEQELKESEEKFRTITEHSTIGIVIIQDDKIKYVNQAILGINEYTIDEMMEWSSKELINNIHPEDRKQAIEYLKGRQTGDYALPPYSSYRIITKSGKIKWIDSYSRTVTYLGQFADLALVTDVTDQNLAKQELKESEEKYRLLFENMNAGFGYSEVIVNDDNKPIDYRFIEVNSQFEKLTGLKVSDIIGKTVTEVLPENDPADWIGRYGKVGLTGEPLTAEDYSEPLDRWYNVSGYSPKKGFFAVTFSDITDRKRAEQKLKVSEEKYRHLFATSPYFIGLIDTKGVLIDCNNVSNEILSLHSKEDIIGKNITEIFSLNEKNKYLIPIFENFIKNTFEGAGTNQEPFDFQLYRSIGGYLWLHIEGTLIEIEKQQLIQFIIQDITERKQAEEKLKDSEEKYRHLFENSPFSIVLLNYEGKIIDMNPKTTELFGYKKEDLIDKNYLTLMDIFPNETIPGLRLVQDLMSKGEPSSPIIKPQITKIYNKDKKLTWVESELSIIKIGGKRVIQAIIQDITEKKLAEEKLKESERILRQQNIELKELDRLKTDFISIAAHDLKTPLISVGGYIDLILLREKELNEEVKEDLNRVLNNVRRLEGYINRLLDVMKIEAKKVELVKREENIHDIIINCLSDLEFQIGQKDLTINFDISENLKLRIDHFRISQAILNLLTNAVKYTPKNGKIDISIVDEGESALFKIKDNGKGLTSEEIQKIFGKFVTIEQGVDGYSSLDKGSGLGLYIAQGFIEAHGGKIWVESKGRDLGAEFSFTLPKQ